VSDFPDTLLRLFSGDNVGKLILDISTSESSDGSPA
jgi:NADPH-dependent curcumin reductase CurA